MHFFFKFQNFLQEFTRNQVGEKYYHGLQLPACSLHLAKATICKQREICVPIPVCLWTQRPPTTLPNTALATRATCARSAPSVRQAASARWVWAGSHIHILNIDLDTLETFITKESWSKLSCQQYIKTCYMLLVNYTQQATEHSIGFGNIC